MAKARKGKQGAIFKPDKPVPVELVHALVNPFHPGAGNVKMHDANSAKTFSYQSRSRKVFATDANGMGYMELKPTLNDCETHMTSAIPTSYILPGAGNTSVASDVADYSAIGSAGAQYRIVSWGIRVHAIEAPLNRSGRVQVRVLAGTQMAVNNRDLSIYGEETYECPVSDCDLLIIPPNNGEYYQDFRPQTYFYANDGLEPYRLIGISIGGATASTDVLSVELVYNLEILPDITEVGARLSSEAAPHSTKVLESVHNARSKMPTTSHSRSFWQNIKQTLGQIAGVAGEVVLGRLGAGISRSIGGMLANYSPPQRVITVD